MKKQLENGICKDCREFKPKTEGYGLCQLNGKRKKSSSTCKQHTYIIDFETFKIGK